MEREIKLSNKLESIKNEAERIFQDFYDFSDGLRMLILLGRKKDGGHNKEEKRMLCTRFSFSSEQYKNALTEMLLLKLLYPKSRIYASVNSRDTKKIIRQIENELADCHYADEERRLFTYKKLIRSPRHFVMQQSCAEQKLFLIDVDDIDDRDILGDAVKLLGELNVEIIKQYKTKNGWHVITKPFNPALFTLCEIKKDALLLLDY